MELPFLSLFNLLAFPCRVRGRQRPSLVANLETCCLDSNPGWKERDLRGNRSCDEHSCCCKSPSTTLAMLWVTAKQPAARRTMPGWAEGVTHHGQVLQAPEFHAAVVLAVSQEADQA